MYPSRCAVGFTDAGMADVPYDSRPDERDFDGAKFRRAQIGMLNVLNRQIILIERPVGVPQPSHFDQVSRPIADLKEGEILVENLFLSVDPAQRGYVNDENNYVAPVPLGSVMRALAVGQVIASKHAQFSIGEHLYGWFGWQEHCACPATSVLRRVDPNQATLSEAAGVLGINGLTAYLALHEIGRPQPNETIVVTAGAGAVGSIVGQLAKLAGCRTIAVVGSEDKGRECQGRFGYDAYVNYHDSVAEALAAACPNGVDILFDNVAGEIADTIVRRMNWFGRIIQCGTVSLPVWVPPPQGPRIEREILTRRLRLEGFVIFDHVARFDAIAVKLATLLRAGELHIQEDIEDGLGRAPQALVDVYSGRNKGKKLIRLRK
jgi:NADPH-dependent curcumin reductase CurA